MKRLEKISIFNMPRTNAVITININSGCNILVLTGYNGVGKSRLLNMLVEVLALVKDVNHVGDQESWLVHLDFESGFQLRGVKIDPDGRPKKNGYEKNVQKLMRGNLPLDEQFSKIMAAAIEEKVDSSYSSKNSDDEGVFCGLYLKAAGDGSAREFVKTTKVVGFINEKVVFGFERPVDFAVFQREKIEGDLNQSLYILIKEFVTTQAVKAGIEEEIRKYLEEYLVANKAVKSGREALAGAKKFVASKMADKQVVEEDSSIFSQHEMFVEINKIFSLTSRKLVYVEGSLSVELKDGKLVPWPSLSRGEKTLLALFLIVFLNRDGAMFVLDEPDLSLHIEWQKMLLPGLMAMAPNCQFVVATHSPSLVMHTGSEQIVNMAKLVMGAA